MQTPVGSEQTNDLTQLGISEHHAPRHPSYATVESRLRSYQYWPPALAQKPRQLAEAGFFYAGEGGARCATGGGAWVGRRRSGGVAERTGSVERSGRCGSWGGCACLRGMRGGQLVTVQVVGSCAPRPRSWGNVWGRGGRALGRAPAVGTGGGPRGTGPAGATNPTAVTRRSPRGGRRNTGPSCRMRPGLLVSRLRGDFSRGEEQGRNRGTSDTTDERRYLGLRYPCWNCRGCCG